MGTRDNAVTIYLDDAEMSQLKQWSQDAGKSISELGRDAILEYTDHDRLHRVEDRLDGIEEMLADMAEAENTHTQAHDTVAKASETVAKTREIASRLQANHDDVLSESDVERAIKDIAGGDPRTVDKYKSELKERDHLDDHPNDDIGRWYQDRQEFLDDLARYLQQFTNPQAKAMQVLSERGIEMPEAADISTRFKQTVVTDE